MGTRGTARPRGGRSRVLIPITTRYGPVLIRLLLWSITAAMAFTFAGCRTEAEVDPDGRLGVRLPVAR